jgi:hypothetical protein
MRIRFTSEEMHAEYPPHFDKGPYSYYFTETEQMVIDRAHSKLLELEKDLGLPFRENVYRNLFPELDPRPVNRSIFLTTPFHNLAGQMLTAFAPAPPAITNKDLIYYPNLDFLCQALWQVKFPSEASTPYNTSFGEELLSRKFRMIEHGPPLVVEPFIKTKEDADWFMENMPDPALQGIWPAYYWEMRQCIKFFPEIVWVGSNCSGPITAAGFIRGIREFLLDTRKNPEMAEATMKAATAFVKYKCDRMMEVLKMSFGPTEDMKKNGGFLYFCDSVDYLRGDEFKRTFDQHYGNIIPHCARKGYPLFLWPTAPPEHLDAICASLEANASGAVAFSTEHPPPEVGIEYTRVKHKLVAALCAQNEKLLMEGPFEAIEKFDARMAAATAKDPTHPGQHMAFVPFAAPDTATPLPNMEFAYNDCMKKGKEVLKKAGKLM